MRALITGASGFIGSHLADALLQKGFKVRALLRPSSNLEWLQGLRVEKAIGELRQGSLPAGLFQDVQYVFHLAGAIEASSKAEYFKINAEGTRVLLEAVRQNPSIKKFILISSQAAGGPSAGIKAVKEEDPPHPVSHYGASKLQAEKFTLEYKDKFPVVILRPPTIYGPRDRRVFAAFKMMNHGFALAVSSTPKWVTLCYIDDLIEAIQEAAFQTQESGRIYNVAGVKPFEWCEFIEGLHRAMDRPYRLFRLPKSLLFLIGLGGEIYTRVSGRQSVFTWQRVKEFVQNSWVMDGKRIQEELGWREKKSLEERISFTASWYRQAGWLK